MNNLTFPAYRIVEDITPDEQLGKYSQDLWNKVLSDIYQAIDENSEDWELCERKIFGL